MTTPPGDATASFSGYLYQADVALLVTLERIKQIYNDSNITNKQNELEKWSLEVEGEEDFTLIKTEERRAVEKHLYQVKEYEKTTKNNGDVLNGTDILKFLDGVVKLFQCTLENSNSNIDCKTYICGKREIVNSSNEVQNSENIIQKLIDSEKKDVGYIKYKILFTSTEKNKSDIKDFYNKCKKGINKLFEAKINQDNEKFKNNFFIGRQKGFGEFGDIHIEIQELISFIKTLKSKGEKEYDDFYKQSDNYLRYFESKIKRMIQENKKKKIEDRIPLNLYGDILSEILDFDRISFKAKDYQDMFLNLFIQELNTESINFLTGGNNFDETANLCDEIGDDEKYNDFIYEFLEEYSSNKLISSNFEILFNILSQISSTKDINEIKNINSFESILSYSDHILKIDNDRIKTYFTLLINLFFIKKEGDFITKKVNKGLYNFERDNLKGTLFGVPYKKSAVKHLVSMNVNTFYEKDYVAIEKGNKNINQFLGRERVTDIDWIENDEKIKEYQKKYSNLITKIKDTHIFCGKYYINNSGNICYMTEDCKTCNRNFND